MYKIVSAVTLCWSWKHQWNGWFYILHREVYESITKNNTEELIKMFIVTDELFSFLKNKYIDIL